MCAVGTGDLASEASDTFLWIKKQFGFVFLRFRVVAPRAAQGTALQKNGGTDPRSVVHTKALNFGYA